MSTETVWVSGGLNANTLTRGVEKFAQIENAPACEDVIFEDETGIGAATRALASMAIHGVTIGGLDRRTS